MADDDFALIPADSMFSADDELAAAEAGIDYDPDFDPEVQPPDPEPFGRSWSFDMARSRFNTLGKGGPAQTHGIRSFQVWAEMALQTERGAHPIYDDDYGVEGLWDMYGQPWNPALVSAYQAAVKQALLAHDRVAEVGDFTFDRNQDNEYVEVKIPVRLDIDDTSTIVLEPRLEITPSPDL